MDSQKIKALYEKVKPSVDFSSLRFHSEKDDSLGMRQGVLEPSSTSRDSGAMLTVYHKGGMGYAATADLSESGLKAAFSKAVQWAESNAGSCVANYANLKMPHPKGEFRSPVKTLWEDVPLSDKISFLDQVSNSLKVSDKIVDRDISLWHNQSERLYLTSEGGEVYQDFNRMVPSFIVTANEGAVTQWRSFGGMRLVRQQGWEILADSKFAETAERMGNEAVELLTADNCPSDTRDLILAPDQMILQIHESIGHPLELDRILGDERNYAGTSFVTQDMIGNYKYGSDLLNITFDPSRPEEAASYAFDDDGLEAKKEFIIRNGNLERVLGGGISQFRAGIEGTANSRADSWRRPAMDRMANLNLEAGDTKFEDMISSVEKGVYMHTNTSWSIDDSRNKFQFGCEMGQLIEDGKLTKMVRNPNYRGISANFWQNLKMVGDDNSFEVMGTPYCGKGEPNQAVFVGHATPACLFSNIEVFGGE
jgi:predicted Zn-dependent protease